MLGLQQTQISTILVNSRILRLAVYIHSREFICASRRNYYSVPDDDDPRVTFVHSTVAELARFRYWSTLLRTRRWPIRKFEWAISLLSGANPTVPISTYRVTDFTLWGTNFILWDKPHSLDNNMNQNFNCTQRCCRRTCSGSRNRCGS